MLPFPAINPVMGDPFWDDVVCLVAMDGANGSTTFTDLSSNAFSTTPSGNAQVSSAQTLFGNNTGLFDASGDFLVVADTTLSSVANATDKTLEAWIRMTTLGRSNTILNKRSASSAHEFSFLVSSANVLTMQAFRSGATVASASGATTLSANTWYHVAAVRSSGGVWKIYVDGVEDGTATESNTPSSNAINLRIARDNFNTSRDFAGHLAEVRYTNAARYTSNFARPTSIFPRN